VYCEPFHRHHAQLAHDLKQFPFATDGDVEVDASEQERQALVTALANLLVARSSPPFERCARRADDGTVRAARGLAADFPPQIRSTAPIPIGCLPGMDAGRIDPLPRTRPVLFAARGAVGHREAKVRVGSFGDRPNPSVDQASDSAHKLPTIVVFFPQ
jgi:hypothetical protein